MTDFAFWRAVWDEKARRGESVAHLSGRGDYSEAERQALVGDAIDTLALDPGDTLLDVGCAAGYTGQVLASRVGKYVGLDTSRRALWAYGRPGLVNGDARSLPFQDGTFTKSYAGAVLLCLPKQDAIDVLSELRRVTRTRALVAETLWGNPPKCRNPGHANCMCFAHVTWFQSPKELIAMAHSAGWRRVQIKDMPREVRSYGLCFNAVLDA